MHLDFYRLAKANSDRMVARGLMKHADLPTVPDAKVAADCRRKRERERIAAARRKKTKGPP